MDDFSKNPEKENVIFSDDGRIEAKANSWVSGPYYAAAEEIDSELESSELPGDMENPKGKDFSLGRRDFMRAMGVATVAGAASCVRSPVQKAIPYVKQPLDHVPGVPVHYATTCAQCSSGCGLVVKTREGRPVKIEGSKHHPINQGALCSLGQAQIQGLYHPERLKLPQHKDTGEHKDINWEKAYKLISERLSSSDKVAILTSGSTGCRQEFFEKFLVKTGSSAVKLYTWDSNTLINSISKAHQLAFGSAFLPRVELSQARVLVGIGSGFQDVGTSTVSHTKGFSQFHSYKDGQKGLFVQFESTMTLTGAKADKRYVIPAGYEIIVALKLLEALSNNPLSNKSSDLQVQAKNILSSQKGLVSESFADLLLEDEDFSDLANKLYAQPSVVLAGGSTNFDENSTLLQLSVILINQLIGAYGQILNESRGWSIPPVRSGDLQRFLSDVDEQRIDTLFVIGVDPIFTTPESWGVVDRFKKIKNIISIQDIPSAVDDFADFVLPAHHPLESWGDEQTVKGFLSIRQPVVRATTGSRQTEDILLWLLAHFGNSLPYSEYRDYLLEKWKLFHNNFSSGESFRVFQQKMMQRGFVGKLENRSPSRLRRIERFFKRITRPTKGLKVVSPLDHRLLDGKGAHLPILQEIGDGLTTIAWDTWVAIHPRTMQSLGIKKNQLVELQTDSGKIEVAAYPMPGTHPDVLVVPRGNGHKYKKSTISYNVGVDPLALYDKRIDPLTSDPVVSQKVTIKPSSKWYRLATMQKHNDIADRKDIIKQYSLEDLSKKKDGKDLDHVPDLFPKLEEGDYRWGMSIDLDSCNGCGACMAACAIENNVAQVGREQVILGRAMHWIRLDRYFAGGFDNPQVTFQPVMCQHCNHAPCEAVCPVYATTHHPEGINQMTYNRCVGTRYCANACPYKVRRFNWFTYKWSVIGKEEYNRNPRALNPDVTVRTRGVMEKCTFCVGRIRDAKHEVKIKGKKLEDQSLQTACQQTCPTDAISFGDLKDPKSQVTKLRKDRRSYLMLGGDPDHHHYGIKTLPNVNYLAKVTHKKMKLTGEHHN
jgi:Fe-S-cluster-containing dehydrogenase component